MELLRLSGVRVGYGREPDVIEGVSLSLAEGETVAILGPSGGGKTTLVKAIAGLLPVRGGTLDVVGVPAPTRPPRGTVGYVPQRLGLVRHASLFDNVVLGGLHRTPLLHSLARRPPVAVAEAAMAALRRLDLADKVGVPVHMLSGGQQRRAAVARALVQRPRILLADEFLGELDPTTMEAVVAAVKELQAATGMGLLIIEHHLDQAIRLADRVYRLKAGQLTALEEAA